MDVSGMPNDKPSFVFFICLQIIASVADAVIVKGIMQLIEPRLAG
jgi:hypothetical protein